MNHFRVQREYKTAAFPQFQQTSNNEKVQSETGKQNLILKRRLLISGQETSWWQQNNGFQSPRFEMNPISVACVSYDVHPSEKLSISLSINTNDITDNVDANTSLQGS